MTGVNATVMAGVGPVSDAFIADKRIITGIMGPFGSAKTTSAIKKAIYATLWQRPGPDGIRRSRGIVVRDTYPQLKKNVLKSWFTWFPKEQHPDWNGEAPFEHRVRLSLGAYGTIEMEVIFLAVGENKIEDVAKGLEATWVWLNEPDTLARSVFQYMMGRIGRYPSAVMGGCAWSGVWLDLNAPDIDNWTYDVLVDQHLSLDPEVEAELRTVLGERFGVGFHRQPGGRSKDPLPENIANLPVGYYQQMMMGQSAWWVRRFVDNEFGAVRNGQPVYPEFNERVHIAKAPLKGDPTRPLEIGVDGGFTPAAVIGQRDSLGRIHVLDELVVFVDNDDAALERLGPTAFGQMLAHKLASRWADFEIGNVWCDPAAGAGEHGEDKSWLQLFGRALGVRAKRCPVKGNALSPRLDAVRGALTRLVDGAEPAFQLSPVCKVLRRGFNNGYVYRRIKLAGGDGRFQDEPSKNDFSHSQDALQYLVIGMGEGRGVATRAGTARGGGGRRVVNESSYNILGSAA